MNYRTRKNRSSRQKPYRQHGLWCLQDGDVVAGWIRTRFEPLWEAYVSAWVSECFGCDNYPLSKYSKGEDRFSWAVRLTGRRQLLSAFSTFNKPCLTSHCLLASLFARSPHWSLLGSFRSPDWVHERAAKILT